MAPCKLIKSDQKYGGIHLTESNYFVQSQKNKNIYCLCYI